MIIFVGDFNVWIDEKENSNTKKLLKIMNKYGLSQLVQEPTNKDGHILDHVYLNRKKLEVKSNVVVDRYGINTDHFPIIIELPSMEKEIKKIEKKCIGKIKDVNIQILKEDFKEACKNAISLSNFESNYKNFHSKCEEIINNHAPKIEITSKNKPKMPWMDAEFRQCKSLRRK